MAIDYFGHCALPPDHARRLIDDLRRREPVLFRIVLHLYDARPLGPFGAEIARDFGIEARSKFMASVFDKGRLAEAELGLDLIYDTFPPGDLVITWGHDSIRPRRR
ncbi:MAG: hypothetical protein PHS60_06640 [Zavarzinia sp.]|nr:hypothetical protein [Zavarzinia sp.]